MLRRGKSQPPLFPKIVGERIKFGRKEEDEKEDKNGCWRKKGCERKQRWRSVAGGGFPVVSAGYEGIKERFPKTGGSDNASSA